MRKPNDIHNQLFEASSYVQQLGDDETGGGVDVIINKQHFRILYAWGGGWDHISISTPTRTPMWHEMETIKRIFFKDNECAMQLHVPVERHINCHPFVLHIWRPQREKIPLPPSIMV
jgi:hypothetical protein